MPSVVSESQASAIEAGFDADRLASIDAVLQEAGEHAGPHHKRHRARQAARSDQIDPVEKMFAVLLIQAPGQREEVQQLFRTMVYSALVD